MQHFETADDEYYSAKRFPLSDQKDYLMKHAQLHRFKRILAGAF